MKRIVRKAFAYLLSVAMVAPSLSLAATNSGPAPTGATATPEELKQLSLDSQVLYWANLKEQMPYMAEFALGGSTDDFPLTKVDQNSPLIDKDPFFMQSQAWENRTADSDCGSTVCYTKEGSDLVLSIEGLPQNLRLHQPLNVILETEEYILLSADDPRIFEAKVPGDSNPGEGVFFITKRDLKAFSAKNAPVPVFFIPLPDPGWTGPNPNAFEMAATNEIVLQNHDGFNLPIDLSDIHLLEKVERDNLMMGITWSFIEHKVAANGVALPKPGITLGFGLYLSGALPDTATSTSSFGFNRIREYAKLIGSSILPAAHAKDESKSVSEEVDDLVRQRAEDAAKSEAAPTDKKDNVPGWRKWILPTSLWGSRVGLGYLAYSHIDWNNLIPAGMTHRIETVGMMMGAVAVATVAMRFAAHKALFDKKYPVTPDMTALQRLNREHKAFLDEFTHASYFSLTMIPTGIRHYLDFLKDRFFPANKIVHTAWEATMGFQLRQNSKLAMNWKTWWYGVWIYGMSDACAVFEDLLIFAPFIAQHLGFSWAGTAMALWASSEVFRNFLSYFQAGAHGYSADVKMIHLKSAEKVAKEKLALEHLDPENPKNSEKLEEFVEAELVKRYQAVGLPTQDQFLYDPNTALQDTMAMAGFSANDLGNLNDEDKKTLASSTFILQRRHWGLIKPALNLALKQAREFYATNPTETGAQTVKLLESSLSNRSVVKAVAGRALDTLSSKWGLDGLSNSVDAEVDKYMKASASADGRPYAPTSVNPLDLGVAVATMKGAYKWLVSDGSKEVKDQRMVLWLMSTIGDPQEMMKFLPKSWLDRAGSPQAAYSGAELFSRSFFTLLQKKPELSQVSPELMAQYRPRAEEVLAEGTEQVTDGFEREVKVTALIQKLKAADERRAAILNYKPKAEGAMATRQWAKAREVAESLWTNQAIDQQVSAEWNGLATTFAERSEVPVDKTEWINTYRYRTIVAREFAKQVNLIVDDPSQSEYVQAIIGTAAMATEKQLSQETEKEYIGSLSENDRRFYEAKIFSTHFVNAYVDRSVHSLEHMKAQDPQFPGRFQKARRWIAGKFFEKPASAMIRIAEAAFRNEEASYAPGRMAWFERNIPFIPDMVANFVRNLRTLPYLLSLSYLTSYYVWQVHSPYWLWFISLTFGFIHPTLVEFNNRLQRNFNKDPMGSAANKATYSFTHGLLTNVEPAVLEMYADPIQEFGTKHVTDNVVGGLEYCEHLLLGH